MTKDNITASDVTVEGQMAEQVECGAVLDMKWYDTKLAVVTATGTLQIYTYRQGWRIHNTKSSKIYCKFPVSVKLKVWRVLKDSGNFCDLLN